MHSGTHRFCPPRQQQQQQQQYHQPLLQPLLQPLQQQRKQQQLFTPPPTPPPRPHGLAAILSCHDIVMAIVPYLLLKDVLNLMLVDRAVRHAVGWRSVPRHWRRRRLLLGPAASKQVEEERGVAEAEAERERMEALQHLLVLLALTTRCKSKHKSPVRIGVGRCAWCGEGVCRVCSPPSLARKTD